jgi:sugar O-acyltransferase (sialic acid O-acetyltransferase NeuD family)
VQKNTLICGAGGLAREVLDILHEMIKYDSSLSFKGFLAPKNTLKPFSQRADLYLGSENNYKFEDNDYAVIAIGDVNIREKVHKKFISLGIPLINIIHPSAIISQYAQIGFGNIIGHHTSISCDVSIGDGNLFNSNNIIHHDCTIGNYNNIYSQSLMTGNAKIKNKNLLGTACTMLPNSSLPNSCKLGASSVLHTSIQDDNQTLIGNPAGSIK